MGAKRWGCGLGLVMVLGVTLAGCGNPHAIGNMPGPVRQVLDTSTLAGINIGSAMLRVTGNQDDIGKGQLPGSYTEGPAAGGEGYYVQFEIPIDTGGIEDRMGYLPGVQGSETVAGDVYMNVDPLPNEAYDRLYYNPSDGWASFEFKILPDGAVMDRTWDAVLVNS